MGTEARSSMEIGTAGKATETEECVRDGAVENPLLTFDLVSRFFYKSINQAARELNVGQTVLKKRCRELGIRRWPNRKLSSLHKLIDDVKELGKDGTPDLAEKTKMVVQKLQQRKRLIEERPDAELDKETKVFRQAVQKEKHLIRARNRELGEALHL
ncbi:unnamed protein product [Alopecurus aequalis]